MNNKILNISLLVARLSQILLNAGAIILLILGIYLMISQDSQLINWIELTESGFRISSDAKPSSNVDEVIISLKLIFAAVQLLIVGFMVKQGMRIIRSIQSLDTFRVDNIKALRMIGNLFVLIFMLGLLEVTAGSPYKISFNIDLYPLLGTLAAFILAEVFREGNRLMEENKLTI